MKEVRMFLRAIFELIGLPQQRDDILEQILKLCKPPEAQSSPFRRDILERIQWSSEEALKLVWINVSHFLEGVQISTGVTSKIKFKLGCLSGQP